MSEHVTGLSNWTAEQKQTYRVRREDGVRGQDVVVTAVKIGSHLSRGKTSGKRARLRQQWRAFRQQERKGSTRGE